VIVLDHAPGAVLGKNDGTARGADEDCRAADVLRCVDVGTAQTHPLAAARDVDDAVDRTAERAELRRQS
jgi:hypothetical protein